MVIHNKVHFFFIFFFKGCAFNFNLLSSTDVNRLRDGGVFKDECDMMVLKSALGVTSFCLNMIDVRKDATDSALKFPVSSIENRKNPFSLSRENTLTLECFDFGKF